MSDLPNIVWITLDSVRLDHTSVGGYDRDTTPVLSSLASESAGRSFSSCFTHSTWTLASSASILTGLYPSRHQVGYGGGNFLNNEIPTVAERLSDAGYRTACVSRNSYLSEATGLDRGFDRFTCISASSMLKAVGVRTALKFLANIRRHSSGLNADTATHATPFLVNDVAKRWVNDLSAAPSPYFLYLHYNEPHRPYFPPLPYLDRYTDDIEMSPEEAAEFSMHVHYNAEEYIANGLDFSDEEWNALKAMYDAEIAYTDEMVGRLVDHVRDRDDDTIVVVTSDHGQAFGERGMLTHMYILHDCLIRVPMVTWGLDIDADGRLVQQSDVMRTILERVGVDTEGIQGVTLDDGDREFVVAQRKERSLEPIWGFNPAFGDWLTESAQSCLRTTEYKYELSEADESALYRIPDDEANVIDEEPEIATDLDEQLREWLATEGTPFGSEVTTEYDERMVKQLRDLGYHE